MYKVFAVQVSVHPYSTDVQFVGAESTQDLIEHLYSIDFDAYILDIDALTCAVRAEKDWRIKEVPHMFTDKPYQVLDVVSYYE